MARRVWEPHLEGENGCCEQILHDRDAFRRAGGEERNPCWRGERLLVLLRELQVLVQDEAAEGVACKDWRGGQRLEHLSHVLRMGAQGSGCLPLLEALGLRATPLQHAGCLVAKSALWRGSWPHFYS